MTEEPKPLTNRQLEMLRAISHGLTNRQIAVQLNVSEDTIDFHVGNILEKLDAASRTEAVAKAINTGIL